MKSSNNLLMRIWLQLLLVAGLSLISAANVQRFEQSENYVERNFQFEYRLFSSDPESALENLRQAVAADLRSFLFNLEAPVTIEEVLSLNRGRLQVRRLDLVVKTK
jgi:hypothetical protein